MTLRQLLERTSRSFYLSLRILPASTRWTVGLAYLLARAADTIADTEFLPADQRLDLLSRYASAMAGDERAPFLADIQAQLADCRESTGELELLRSQDRLFAESDRLDPGDRPLVIQLIQVIVEGMRLDLTWFPPGQLNALTSEEQLERYCYHVAGSVGEFWTAIHARHFPDVDPALTPLGVCYGQGLQRINILRDLPRDLRRGRCYLPLPVLEQAGLTPADLLQTESYTALRPIYQGLLAQTRVLLDDGRRYLLRIPRRRLGLHLATRWPLELGQATVRLLESANNPLDPDRVLKITRRQVYGILGGSLARTLLPGC